MINGKGIYIWYLNRGDNKGCIAGNTRLLVWLLKVSGFGHVLLKVADGTAALPGDIARFVALCHQEGIQVFGWQYIYTGSNNEADVAIRLCFEYELDGFIVNAEKQFDRSGRDAAAANYMGRLRSGLGDDFTIGLSSYRYPSFHAEFPWRAFLEKCNLVMPQVYWMEDESSLFTCAGCENMICVMRPRLSLCGQTCTMEISQGRTGLRNGRVKSMKGICESSGSLLKFRA
jgi:hypothetical protein